MKGTSLVSLMKPGDLQPACATFSECLDSMKGMVIYGRANYGCR